MKVRCERDLTVFDGDPTPYPGGRWFIECPICGRRYFEVNTTPLDVCNPLSKPGEYWSDRKLTIL